VAGGGGISGRETLTRDIRYAIRSLSRARGFAFAVVLTLGLGIGANTAIFSVGRGVMLKPLPHKNGDRLMYLRQSALGPGRENVAFSVPEINDFRSASRTLGGIAEYSPLTFNMIGERDAVRIDAGLVTGNYFDVIGLSPVIGRAFGPGDDGPGAAPVMILTHEYWLSRFGGDTGIVGKQLRVGGKAVSVVGILQPAPNFPAHIDALMNMVNSAHHLSALMQNGRTHRMTEMVARLAPGATVEQARANEIRVDGAVLGFALLLAVSVAVLLSFAPTLVREDALGASLSSGAKRATGGVRRQRLQQMLVVLQVAVSVVLLTGAGLLTRTMQRLSTVDTGLNGTNVLTMEIPSDFGGIDQKLTLSRYEQMQREVSALPGVSQVGLGSTMPLRTAGFMLDIKAEGRAVTPGEPQPHSEYRTANPDYFHAAGIPLVQGREFTTTDRSGSANVVILNQTLSDLLFPNHDAVGRRVAWTGDVLKFIGISGDWRTVVGVVGTTKDGGLDAEPMPVTFTPFAQSDFPSAGLVIQSTGDAAAVAPAATKIIRAINPTQPIEKVETLQQIKDESVAPRRLNAQLVASFGVLALIVASVGIAAVLAFSVSARTNEIGIRMSLGADSGSVLRMVLREGGILVGLGLLIGVAGALLLSKLVQGLLFGVEARDPATLAVVAVVMMAVGIGACWIPAARAARIDPGVALRAQ
jgi:hypothetical protein